MHLSPKNVQIKRGWHAALAVAASTFSPRWNPKLSDTKGIWRIYTTTAFVATGPRAYPFLPICKAAVTVLAIECFGKSHWFEFKRSEDNIGCEQPCQSCVHRVAARAHISAPTFTSATRGASQVDQSMYVCFGQVYNRTIFSLTSTTQSRRHNNP